MYELHPQSDPFEASESSVGRFFDAFPKQFKKILERLKFLYFNQP